MKYQPHQLIEEQIEEPKETLDEEDLHDILSGAYIVLEQVKERKLPKRLHSDIIYLLDRIEATITWHKLH